MQENASQTDRPQQLPLSEGKTSSSPMITNSPVSLKNIDTSSLEGLAGKKQTAVEPTIADKQAVWEAKRKEIDGIKDALGLGIDERIKETVVAFNVLGFNTSQSCEGHLEHAYVTPYVDFQASYRPETEYLGEMDVFQRVAQKYKLSLEDVRRAFNIQAWREAISESSRNGYAPEYLDFLEQTRQMRKTFEPLLEEFNQGREIDSWIQLHVDERDGFQRVWSGGQKIHTSQFEETLPTPVRAALLLKRQAEMQGFGNFLREKYFSGNNNHISNVSNSPK